MKKFLLSLLCLIFMAVTAGAETYTHTFKSGELTTAGGSVTLSDIEWTASSATYIGWDNNNGRGIQLGSKNTLNPTYQLSTSALAGCTIRSITVNSSIASNGDAKLTISVGSQTSEAYTLTTSDAAYTFDCEDTTGDISINWTATDRAYYVKSITIEYTPDAGTVIVPTPEFKTPAVVYADKVKVTAETTDQSAVLYYTLDGTDPSYEDYVNETGSTKCSKYWVMYFDLTQTTTIKVIAVKTDGDVAFKSAVAEQTYIVSRTMPYVPASSIASGSKYAIVAADSAATYYYEDKAYGYLPTKTATAVNGKYIETVECAGFTFTAVDGGYTIQDELGRYVYHTEARTNFNYAAEQPAEGAVWSVDVDTDGNATIACDGYTVYYSTKYETYGCYPADKVTEEHVLPKLFMQREYPTYTVTPENNATIDKLEKIIITCEEGIAATNDLVIKAEGKSATFTIEQTDSKTLTVTPSSPITTENNMELNINITAGDIILNPEVMSMSFPVPKKYGVRKIAKYLLTGNAPAATIEKITPANGSTVEKLSYVLFRFSYFPNVSEDETRQPRLHAEGSEELIALEYTTLKEDGSGHVHMMEAALKVVEPIITNGTYILEIPTGYFIDANNKDIKGVTLKYIVKNSTGIEEVETETGMTGIIYDLQGRKVENLSKGIYIVNGKKVLVK